MPLPVLVALLYPGVMSLFLVWLVQAWPEPNQPSVVATAAWIESGGAEAFRNRYRGVHILLVGFLWFSARGGVGGRSAAPRWWLAGAALLVLAVHRALDAALSALPRIHLLPWPMGH